MEIFEFSGFETRKYELIGRIRDGAIFVYPTDTIYGLGCDATNFLAVEKIRTLKNRTKAPFSVIVPNIDWIFDNCFVNDEVQEYLNKLPGPYTLILKLKNPFAIANNVTFSDTIGVRIPDHGILSFLSLIKKPIITTSVNKSGEDYLREINECESDFKQLIDFCIDAGKIEGKPSKVIDLVKHQIIRS